MTDNIEQTDPDLWDAARKEAVRRHNMEPCRNLGTAVSLNAHARTLLELGWRPPEKVSDAVLCWREYMAEVWFSQAKAYRNGDLDHFMENATDHSAITFALAWAAERAAK